MEIAITARPQTDPRKCSFEVDRKLSEGSTFFGKREEAEGAPLAEQLFALEGVEQVSVRDNVVTITQDGQQEWSALAKLVGAAIRGQLASGEPPLGQATPAPASAAPSAGRPIRILARPTGQPDRCDFEVDTTVIERIAWFGDAESAKGSPLPEALFAIDGVKAVLMRGRIVTVTHDGERDWSKLAKQVGAAIRAQLQSGAPPVAPGAGQGELPQDQDHGIRERVQKVIDDQINPAIAAHGGYIRLQDVRGGIISIMMGGGCQGCASSMATLKQGVEVAIKQAVPEVVEIIDLTDHEAGANPYM